MLRNDTSPLAPVITPSCSQRTIRSISSPSFHLRYLQPRRSVYNLTCASLLHITAATYMGSSTEFSMEAGKLDLKTMQNSHDLFMCRQTAYLYATEATSFLSISSSTNGFGFGNLYFSFPWKETTQRDQVYLAMFEIVAAAVDKELSSV